MFGIKLLHDNSPAHKSKLVQEIVSKENIQNVATSDTKTKQLCRCSGSLLWKDAGKKTTTKKFIVGDRYLNRWVSYIPETPSYVGKLNKGARDGLTLAGLTHWPSWRCSAAAPCHLGLIVETGPKQ